MSQRDTISIIILVNRSTYHLSDTIKSCIDQTYRNIEIIVADHNGDSQVANVIQQFNDNRLKYLKVSSDNKADTLNYIINKLSGNYFTWIYANDQFLPDSIDRLYSNFKNDIDLVYANHYIKNYNTNSCLLKKYSPDLDLVTDNSIPYCFMVKCQSSNITGQFDRNYELAYDFEYFVRLLKKGKSLYCSDPLLTHYIEEENVNPKVIFNRYSTKLSKNIALYKNEYIHVYQYGYSIFHLFIGIFLDSNTRFNLLYILKMLYKIFTISIPLGFASIGLLAYFTLRYFASYIIYYPIEYIKYTLFINNSKLTPTADKSNILCIVPFMVVGGAEKVILNIVENTDSSKFDFHIITTERANNTWYNKFQGYFKNTIVPNIRSKNLCYKYIYYLIKKLNINTVLITNSMYGYDYIPLLKQDFKDIKIIDITHSEYSIGAVIDQKQVAQLLDYRVCISNRLKQYMEELYKFYNLNNGIENRLAVIYNGVDTLLFKQGAAKKGKFKEKFSIPDHVKIITFIGRLSSEKNPVRFVDIANRFISKYNNEVKFVIAGDGPELEKVKNKIKGYGIQDKFLLTGVYNDIPELLSDAHILIVSSDTEGIPFVILEAMAMGVPVISTNVGAISEVINDGENSYLIDLRENMIDTFATRIENLINNDQTYKLVSNNAQIAVEAKYSVEIMAKKYEELFMGNMKNN